MHIINQIQLEEIMRSSGKLYTVGAVCFVILLGILFYIFNLDKKIKQIEKKMNMKK